MNANVIFPADINPALIIQSLEQSIGQRFKCKVIFVTMDKEGAQYNIESEHTEAFILAGMAIADLLTLFNDEKVKQNGSRSATVKKLTN